MCPVGAPAAHEEPADEVLRLVRHRAPHAAGTAVVRAGADAAGEALDGVVIAQVRAERRRAAEREVEDNADGPEVTRGAIGA